MQPLSIAEGTTAVPTPVMSRKERQLRKHVLESLFRGGCCWAAVSGFGRAPSRRRTAVVEAVEKVQRCVVSITSEKLASSHSRWPFSPEENRVGWSTEWGAAFSSTAAGIS